MQIPSWPGLEQLGCLVLGGSILWSLGQLLGVL
jgi:hypothetical protein